MDENGEPVGVGAVGELYIGGVGLARGYLNQPGMTAERFVPHPFSEHKGERLYRTGDRVRWRSDGNLEFLGRFDHQIKIRGFRVELGEIENTLTQHDAVRQAVVISRGKNADQQLIAYVTLQPKSIIERRALRSWLGTRLPDYMVPAAIVVLEQLPLNANGKVDRKALPEIEAEPMDTYSAPRTPSEEMVAGIWAEVLHRERIGSRDNFFELGGHSLLATQVVSRIGEAFGIEMPLRMLFEAPTVEGLAEQIEQKRRVSGAMVPTPFRRADRDRPLPLSYAQQRLWFIDQLEPGSPLYNIPFAVRLNGEIEVEALAGSLNEIVRRHEVLRTSFPNVNGELVQHIADAAEVPLARVDLSVIEGGRGEALALAVAEGEGSRVFDLGCGPLLRATLVRLGPADHVLLLSLHHIASDGWSVGILVREFSTLYTAYCQGRPSPLSELEWQYADFACWQRQWLTGEVLQGQLDYWRRQLEGVAPLELPLDRPRPARPTHAGATLSFTLAEELSEQLRSLSRQEGVTLFMTLLAAFQLLLARYSGQKDIAVGTDVANRNRLETEPLIGFFVNQLVLRTDLSGDPTFRQLLARVRRVTLEAYDHQDLPFEKLVEELTPERDLSRSPLFQVKLVLQNMPPSAPTLPELELRHFNPDNPIAKVDLTLFFLDSPPNLTAQLEYSTELFEQATILELADRYMALLAGIVTHVDRPSSYVALDLQSADNSTVEEFCADEV